MHSMASFFMKGGTDMSKKVGDKITFVSRFTGDVKSGVIEESFMSLTNDYGCYFLRGQVEMVTDMQIL